VEIVARDRLQIGIEELFASFIEGFAPAPTFVLDVLALRADRFADLSAAQIASNLVMFLTWMTSCATKYDAYI
jgi:hypothetical protein